MSDETKKTTATEPEAAAKGETKQKKEAKAKPEPKAKVAAGSALKSVGLDACKRHGVAEVWVTADGQSFAKPGDAKAHAANLNDKQILNVKAE